jgi:hypothetical protein
MNTAGDTMHPSTSALLKRRNTQQDIEGTERKQQGKASYS